MLEELIGRTIEITTGPEGQETIYNLTVDDVEGSLIKVRDVNGNVRIINAASANVFEIAPMKS